jgi:hypothetical protein
MPRALVPTLPQLALALGPLLALGAGKQAPAPTQLAPAAVQAARTFDRQATREFLFHAVLEGLYADGVGNDAVDSVLERDLSGEYPLYFVWGCPICMPCYDACRVYRARPKLTALKGEGELDTWGPGLSLDETAGITSAVPQARQAAIEELIERWVQRRMDLMRLDQVERAELRLQLEQGRKLGMSILQSGSAPGGVLRTTCPFCEGACKPR